MKEKKLNLLSKAAKGQQSSDVANTSIRNLLTLLSAENKISQEDMWETEEFFEWKCPYTGADIKDRICSEPRDRVVLDHIVPQNREHCGLNVKGNLVWVDRTANAQKSGMTVEEFMLNNTGVLGDTPEEVRKERLRKIKQFQKQCGYNPDEIKRRIGNELDTIYSDTTDRQKDLAMELETMLNSKPARGRTNVKTYEKKNRQKKNTEKYVVGGNEYSKRGLALFVVEDYISNNPETTYDELMNIFDMKLSFDGKPIIRLQNSVSEKEKEASRVYWKNPIKLTDGNIIVVNTQWQKDDMPKFLKIVKGLGYEVI